MFAASAKHAGVRPPTTPPKFSIRRGVPIWLPNNRVSGVANADATPIFDLSATQDPIYHYQTDGNAYLRQLWHAEMRFEPTASAPGSADIFAFKCLVRPHQIEGRRMLFSSKGDSARSGGVFVDMVDGKARVGWYDTVQKREVWIETSVPVFEPHHWHYLYVRKRYPDATLGSGGWTDTLHSGTSGTMDDVLLVRRFRKAAANIWQQRTWDYKPSASTRNFIGFTTDLEYSVTDSSGVGLVSRDDPTLTFTGNAAGQVTASAACFSPDMLGMLFCPGTGPHQGKRYVISSYTSTTVVNVVDAVSGAAPDLSALVADPGGVYTGVKLLKSEGFDESEAVDQTEFDIELFGSHLSGDEESGVMPFVGEFASFAYVVDSGPVPAVFQAASGADYADDGADQFGNVEIYASSATAPGELHVDSAQAFTAVDTQPYAGADATSSVPNDDNEVAVDATASSANAQPLTWQFVVPRGNLEKPWRVRCAFYDPDQAQVSSPGPELVIDPGGDDATNTSAALQITLSELPDSPDRGEVETWVYMTQPGDFTYFKLAEVPRGATSISLETYPEKLARGLPLDTNAWPPPECRVLEVSQGRLVCGDLREWVNDDDGVPRDFPDLVVFSRPNAPLSFPSENLLSFYDASREGVTGLRDYNGRLVVTKRDSMHRAVLREGAGVSEVVSKKFGCGSGAALVEHEGVLLFWGKRGIYAYDGSGIPRWVGDRVEALFQRGVEPGSALEAVGAVNPQRNQVVLTLRELNALYTSHRLSIEPFSGGLRFSRYEGPNVTALVDHATDKAEVGVLVAGTEEGFFVWLDRSDTPLAMMGAAATHGASTLTAGVGATSTRIPVSGTLDTSLAGPRGAVARWGNVGAVVLASENGALLLDRPASPLPSSGDVIRLGTAPRFWETRWLDFDDAEFRKRARYLDVVTTLGTAVVTCMAYKDFGVTPFSLIPYVTNAPASAIDTASRAVTRFDIGHLNARHLKFRFESNDPFELVELVVRVSDGDAY